MKHNFFKSFCLLLFCTIASVANAQSNLIDLKNPGSYQTSLSWDEGLSLEMISSSNAPAGIPAIPNVNTDYVFKLVSKENNLGWWDGMRLNINAQPEITETHNTVSFLLYASSSDDLQGFFSSEFWGNGYTVYFNWKLNFIPNKWQIVTFDLSDPQYFGKKVGCLELCPGLPNRTTYVLPFWGETANRIKGQEVPMITEWGEEEANYFFTYWGDQWVDNPPAQTMEAINVSDLPADIASSFQGNSDKLFRIQTHTPTQNGADVWFWDLISQLNFMEPIEIQKNYQWLHFWVYTPNDMINFMVQSDNRNIDGGMAHLPDNCLFHPTPNQWTDIQLNFSGLTGQKLKMIEICPEARNITLYIYPWWETAAGGSAIRIPDVMDNKPYLVDGIIRISQAANIQLYNTKGQRIESVYGTSVKAVNGINIIVVDNVSYKLLNP